MRSVCFKSVFKGAVCLVQPFFTIVGFKTNIMTLNNDPITKYTLLLKYQPHTSC